MNSKDLSNNQSTETVDHGIKSAVNNLIEIDDSTSSNASPSSLNVATGLSSSAQESIDDLAILSSPSTVVDEPLASLKIECTPNIIDNIEQKVESTQSNDDSTRKESKDDLLLDSPSQNKLQQTNCDNCKALQAELAKIKSENEDKVDALQADLKLSKEKLNEEIQRRVELMQHFIKRTDERLEQLSVKSNRNDAAIERLRSKFEKCFRETPSMIETFTTNNEVLTNHLLELRNENDYFVGQYLNKARELQNAEIDLPQSVEELQFHCLTLNEKLILTTMAKERLEETLAKSSNANTNTTITPPPMASNTIAPT